MKFLLISVSILLSANLFSAPGKITEFIKVDQFGYRINDQKVAVISNPINGFNDTIHFTPGHTYQVRRWSDDAVIFSGTKTAWNGGAIHTQSGDKVWWFNFSAVKTEGDYYIYDVDNAVGSYKFTINNCVYDDVMKAALRTYYYQRCGIAKKAPYADAGWTDTKCHAGIQQDLVPVTCMPLQKNQCIKISLNQIIIRYILLPGLLLILLKKRSRTHCCIIQNFPT